MPIGYDPKLPFAEQIDFFRNKAGNLIPTKAWTDVWKGQHDRAFMVAGAAKADLLSDLYRAVERGISQGTGIGEFRKAFDATVKQHGWDYTGERNWRTRVIYQTNISTSYAAGRLVQLKEGGFRYWMYKHSDSVMHPRPLHLSWDGITLPADHPWWQTHSPPNGWGCKCRLIGVRNAAGAKRLGGSIVDAPPNDGVVPGTDRPNGIDKGWDYQPGATVAQPIMSKLGALPPEIGVALGEDLRRNAAKLIETDYKAWIDEVLADDHARGRSVVLSAMGAKELAFLKEKDTLPQRTDISLDDKLVIGKKAARHESAGDALTDDEWRTLSTRIMTELEAVLYDNDTGNLLYVLSAMSGDRQIKIVVKPDYFVKALEGKQTQASVRSVFKVMEQALLDRRRYTVIDGEVRR